MKCTSKVAVLLLSFVYVSMNIDIQCGLHHPFVIQNCDPTKGDIIFTLESTDGKTKHTLGTYKTTDKKGEIEASSWASAYVLTIEECSITLYWVDHKIAGLHLKYTQGAAAEDIDQIKLLPDACNYEDLPQDKDKFNYKAFPAGITTVWGKPNSYAITFDDASIVKYFIYDIYTQAVQTIDLSDANIQNHQDLVKASGVYIENKQLVFADVNEIKNQLFVVIKSTDGEIVRSYRKLWIQGYVEMVDENPKLTIKAMRREFLGYSVKLNYENKDLQSCVQITGGLLDSDPNFIKPILIDQLTASFQLEEHALKLKTIHIKVFIRNMGTLFFYPFDYDIENKKITPLPVEYYDATFDIISKDFKVDKTQIGGGAPTTQGVPSNASGVSSSTTQSNLLRNILIPVFCIIALIIASLIVFFLYKKYKKSN